jgi:secreted PhoX family phosphatase
MSNIDLNGLKVVMYLCDDRGQIKRHGHAFLGHVSEVTLSDADKAIFDQVILITNRFKADNPSMMFGTNKDITPLFRQVLRDPMTDELCFFGRSAFFTHDVVS